MKQYPKAHDKNDSLILSGYHFYLLKPLIPETNELGHALKFYPQKRKRGRKLHKFGSGAFCRFHIDAPDVSGVYLWVLDNQILYIGRTKHLAQRFNNGYGKISASNCYIGGTITNCRMNKVLLELFERGKIINLYFYKTRKYKVVELNLLRAISTPYNIKDN